MVFEQLIKTRWLESRPRFAFLLGFFYSMLGILSAKLIFPSSAGIMSVAFIAILLIPSLNKLLAIEEVQEVQEKKFSLIQLFKDHYDILEIYIFIFFGMFITFLFFSFFFPDTLTLSFFSPQLKVAGISGAAAASLKTTALKNTFFWNILKNNLVVLLVSFVLSLIYGAGSILFLAWNASVWGVVFGFVSRQSIQAENLFYGFTNILLPSLPHLFTEGLSYFLAAIVGGILSKAIIREKLFSRKFNHVLVDALLVMCIAVVVVAIAAYIEVFLV